MRRSKWKRLQALLDLAARPPRWGKPKETEPYKKGDRVTHKGKIWRSQVDRNTREPGEYGWEELV